MSESRRVAAGRRQHGNALSTIIKLDSASMSSCQGYQKDLKFRRRVNIEKKRITDYTGSSHRGGGPKASALELTQVMGWRLKPPSARCGQNFTLTIKNSSTLGCRWSDFSILSSSMLVWVGTNTATSVLLTKPANTFIFTLLKHLALKPQHGSGLGLLFLLEGRSKL